MEKGELVRNSKTTRRNVALWAAHVRKHSQKTGPCSAVTSSVCLGPLEHLIVRPFDGGIPLPLRYTVGGTGQRCSAESRTCQRAGHDTAGAQRKARKGGENLPGEDKAQGRNTNAHLAILSTHKCLHILALLERGKTIELSLSCVFSISTFPRLLWAPEIRYHCPRYRGRLCRSRRPASPFRSSRLRAIFACLGAPGRVAAEV